MPDDRPLSPPRNQADLVPICDALVRLFDPFAEVVVHDLATQTIAHIAGNLSGREVGDASFVDGIDPENDLGPVIGPYVKTNPDGRQIKSISVLFRDPSGLPQTLLCINVDVSRFDAALSALSRFASVPVHDRANPLADDWLDTLNRFVADWRIENGLSDATLSVTNRHRLLRALSDRGVFDRPKAADAVARAAGVSRATVYNDLRAIASSGH